MASAVEAEPGLEHRVAMCERAAAALEALRIEYLGRKGRLTGILRRLGELCAQW